MKTEIVKALKTKFKSLGVSDKVFETVADTLTDRVKEESEIETAIAGVEPLLKAIQGEADKVRGEKAKTDAKLAELQKQIELLSKKDDPQPEPAGGDPEKAPAPTDPVMAEMLKSLKALTEQVVGIKQEKVQESRKASLDKVLANAPAFMKPAYALVDVNGFKTEEEFQQYLTTVQETVTTTVAEAQKQGLDIPNPVGGHKEPPKKVEAPTAEEEALVARSLGL
jgi:DNA repair exonuclease SbcCD ATPase subunit